MSKLGIFAAEVATGAIATSMLKGVIDEIDNRLYSPLNSDLSPTAAGDETVPNNRPSEVMKTSLVTPALKKQTLVLKPRKNN